MSIGRNQRPGIIWSVLLATLTPGILEAAELKHQYSFEAEPGSTTVTDRRGDADGTVIGNADFTGDGKLNLVAEEEEPYVDLPNGIISAQESATFEAWVTFDGKPGAWQRIFDFGNNSNGEGEQGTGTTYVFLTPRVGTSGPLRFAATLDPGGSPREIPILDGAAPLPAGEEVHVAVTYDFENEVAKLFLNGRVLAEGEVAFPLTDIDDVNNWLGRSNWPDAPFDGRFNEFRIYNGALSEAAVASSFGAGAETVTETVVAIDAPPNGQTFVDASSGIRFSVISESGVQADNIELLINGEDRSEGLEITGSASERTVAFNQLEPNQRYNVEINVTNNDGQEVRRSLQFDTLSSEEAVVIEAEDYNFSDGVCDVKNFSGLSQEPTEGGRFRDDPPPGNPNDLTFPPNPDNGYHHLVGMPNVDFSDTTSEVTIDNLEQHMYRACDPVGTQESDDFVREKYTTASVPDHEIFLIEAGEWLNYTRTFEAGTYQLFLRASGTAQTVRLSRVTSDPSQPSQLTEEIGSFSIPERGIGQGGYQTVALTDPTGENRLTVDLQGEETLRLTAAEADNNLQLNFFALRQVETKAVPPEVNITAPEDGAGFVPDATVTLEAEASDSDGKVAKVAYRILSDGGTKVIGEAQAAPYTVEWQPAEEGSYRVLAQATDDSGLVNESEPIGVVVDGTRPELANRARGRADINEVILSFSERLSPGTAADAGNYSVTEEGGASVTVDNATLANAGRKVRLETGELSVGTRYTVTVSNVTDAFGINAIAENSEAIFFGLGQVDPNLGLVHRYDFSGSEGDNTVADLVGEANGSLNGNASFTDDGRLDLSPNGSQAFVDLPNGIVSALQNATFEAWVTFDGENGAWQRIFDFGNNSAGEGEQGTGQTYLFLTPRVGTDGPLRFAITLESGGNESPVLNGTDTLPVGTETHVAVTYDIDDGVAKLFQDGELVDSGEATISLGDIQDVNNWLGRSNWPDAPFDGKFNEFRIYDRALSESEIARNAQAGPDALPREGAPPAPSIEIASPEPLTRFSANSNVEITVDITDEVSEPQTVAFFADGEKIGESTSAPFSFVWENASTGFWSVVARVTNAIFESGSSDPVRIVVGSPPVRNLPPQVVLTENTRLIEAEDYNYDGGKWIEGANGGPTGDPYEGGEYTGLLGVQGIDYNDDGGGGAGTPYRFEEASDVPGPATRDDISTFNRGGFNVDENWVIGWTSPGEWLNYTRTFPEEETTYEVIASIASGGGDPNPILGRVTSDPSQESQTVETLGEFSGAASGDWLRTVFYKMHEPGDPDTAAKVTLSGTETLRLTMGGTMDPDYLAFVPAEPDQKKGPKLDIAISGGTVTITWKGDASLQSAPTINGPWSSTGKSSPASFSVDGTTFFRAVQ